jgi:hypothetical protein
MRISFRIVCAGAFALAASAPARAQGPTITVSPARPSQGQLVTITLRDARVASAALAGEPVHFGGTASRASALAAIPVDAKDSLPLRMQLASGDSLVRWIRVRPASWPVERLRVAARYGSKPDSALEARTDEEMHRALEVSRRSHDTPRLWTPGFVRPRPGRVTSGFGKGREYNGELTSRHMGTDFAGATGTPVKATNRGVVALADTFYYGGRVIYVDHGEGLVSAYMHLSRADVAVGDTVAKGQVIGRVGATGRVTGPHLHWVVRYGAITVDPLSLPRLTPAPAPARARPAPARGASKRSP